MEQATETITTGVGECSKELIPFSTIRVESALSRFPIHNLAKTGRVNIQIIKKNEKGETTLKWEVSYSDRYGQARQLAYHLDTLYINRKIDELSRPLPEVIPLGSLREIAEALNLGGDTVKVKKALRQNAFASIVAKITYRGTDGTEKYLEADFQRYSVVFTGEKLPDGATADMVYLVLNKIYREVLNTSTVKPLNYDYMAALPPAARRLYEIMSGRVFATIKHKGKEAKIAYSEYCTYSAQQRYGDYDHVKKQMYKVNRPHLQSGYISKVHYQKITDEQGQADWMMCYSIGNKAIQEYNFFNKAKLKKEEPPLLPLEPKRERGETTSKPTDPIQPPSPQEDLEAHFTDGQRQLIKQLNIEFGITVTKAAELVSKYLETTKEQLAAWSFRNTKITNRAGWMVEAIEHNYNLPEEYLTLKAKQEAQRRSVERQALIDACPLCDKTGFRFIIQDGRQCAKPCSHDPSQESKYQSA